MSQVPPVHLNVVNFTMRFKSVVYLNQSKLLSEYNWNP